MDTKCVFSPLNKMQTYLQQSIHSEVFLEALVLLHQVWWGKVGLVHLWCHLTDGLNKIH